MTVGQINIWRRHVYAAMLEAVIQRRAFSKIPSWYLYR